MRADPATECQLSRGKANAGMRTFYADFLAVDGELDLGRP